MKKNDTSGCIAHDKTTYMTMLSCFGSSLGILSSGHCGVDLLAILPANTGRGCTVATALT